MAYVKFPEPLPSPPPDEPATPASAESGPSPPTDATQPQTSAGPPDAWTWGTRIAAGLVLALAFFLGSFRASNSDVWMSLATGKALVEGRYTFGVDPFSWATEGVFWANPSWLWSVVAHFIHSQWSGATLVAFKACWIVAIAGLLLATRSRTAPRLAAIELTALALIVASPRFGLQPAAATLVGLAALAWLLRRGGYWGGGDDDEPVRAGAWWQMPLLFLVWANVDAYFTLGLATLGLSALGLSAFAETRARGVALGKILGVCTAACVLNPHLLANFTLPADVAALVGGSAGRAALAVTASEAGAPPMVNAFAATLAPQLGGWNAATIAFWVLVFVNLGSFVVAGMVPHSSGLLARGFVCLVFGVAATLNYRLIPFYAILAGPISLLNWTDYLSESRKFAGFSVRAASTSVANFALISILFLAWPGWLHLPFDQFSEDRLFQSPRRVLWEIYLDTSLADTMRALDAQASADQPLRVYHSGAEFAHYAAYFANHVRGGVDVRWHLFEPIAKDYAGVRSELWEAAQGTRGRAKKGEDPTWPDRFRKWKVDAVAITSFQQASGNPSGAIASHLLLDGIEWKPLRRDGRTLVFAWSPTRAWRGDELWSDLTRDAFSNVPQKQRPYGTPVALLGEVNWLDQYMSGPGLNPASAHEAMFLFGLHQTAIQRWRAPLLGGWAVAQVSPAAGHMGLVPAPILGFSGAWGATSLLEKLLTTPVGHEPDALHSADFGPPSLPILAQRALRRAVVENPRLPLTHNLLVRSQKALLQQEAWYNRHQTPGMRSNLRNLQLVASAYNGLAVAPESVELHLEMADILHAQNYRDVGLHHLEQAIRFLDQAPARTPNEVKRVRDQREELSRRQQILKGELDRRKADFDLHSARKSDWDKVRMALLEPYREIDVRAKDDKGKDGKPRESIDPRGRGLALEALRHLALVNPESLPAEEKTAWAYLHVDLLLKLGRVGEAFGVLGKQKETLGPSAFNQCVLFFAYASGSRADADGALDAIEKEMTAEAKRFAKTAAGAAVAMLIPPTDGPARLLREMGIGAPASMILRQNTQLSGTIAEHRALRGILALEHGDVDAATKHLKASLDSSLPFPDRPAAARYLELIERQAKSSLRP